MSLKRFFRGAVALPLSAAIAVAIAVSSARAADEPTYELVYKFKPGETARWVVVHRATVTSTIQETTKTARTRSDSVKRWDAANVTPEGAAQIAHSVESIKMVNELPDRARMEYDSLNDAEIPQGFEQAAAAVGVPLTVFRMDKTGKILRRERKHVQPGSDPETPIAIPLPRGPVSIGHVWTEPQKVKVQVDQDQTRTIETRRRFELKAVTGNLATIAVDYQVLTPNRNAVIEAQLVQRLYSGELTFDINAGRVTKMQLDVDKKVVGFSGPASSMHYVMRLTERLLGPDEMVARKPQKPAAKAPQRK